MASTEELENKGWELTSVNVKFESYPVEQSLFLNGTLNSCQKMIRESLIGLGSQEDLNAVCMPLLQIINR